MKTKILTALFAVLAIACYGQRPAVTFTTSFEKGRTMNMQMRLSYPDAVYVDWGDGHQQRYPVLDKTTDIAGVVAGPTVKIYSSDLTYLDCTSCGITEIDVTRARGLQQLYASKNAISSIDVSGNTRLVRLGLNFNRISSLDLSRNKSLTGLYLLNNALSSRSLDRMFGEIAQRKKPDENVNLRISGNPGALVCNTAAAVAKNWTVDVQGDGSGGGVVTLTTTRGVGEEFFLEVRTSGTSSVSVDFGGGEVSYPTSSKSSKIVGRIEAGNTVRIYADDLIYLGCERDGLTSVDVSQIRELQQLYCGWNELTSIDVSNNNKLRRLGASDNRITGLVLDNHPFISGLYLQNNMMQGDALDRLFKQVPRRSRKQDKVNLRVMGNPGAGSCNAGIAENKNWTVDILNR